MDCTMMNATETLMKNILAAVAVLLWLGEKKMQL